MSFSSNREPGPLRTVTSWAQELSTRDSSSRRAMQLARLDDGYLVRFPRLVDFEISLDGRSIAAIPCPGLPAAPLDRSGPAAGTHAPRPMDRPRQRRG
jgi:hypothetical protein